MTQYLKPGDHALATIIYIIYLTTRASKWAFSKKIFSDEEYFELDGCVNKQNCRLWGLKLQDRSLSQTSSWSNLSSIDETLQLVRMNFQGRVNSHPGDVVYPLAFFLWGFFKGKVCENRARIIPELQDEILRAIYAIEPELRQNTSEHFVNRSQGGHAIQNLQVCKSIEVLKVFRSI